MKERAIILFFMDELEIQGKKYISSKRAAEMTGYAKDYIGQLIRTEKIQGIRFGRAWFVVEEEILAHAGIKTSEDSQITGEIAPYQKAALGTALGNPSFASPLHSSHFQKQAHLPKTWSNIKYLEDDAELLPRLSEKKENTFQNNTEIRTTKVPDDAVVYVRKESLTQKLTQSPSSADRVKVFVDGIAPRLPVIRVASQKVIQISPRQGKKLSQIRQSTLPMVPAMSIGAIAVLILILGLSGMFLSSQTVYVASNGAYTANILAGFENFVEVIRESSLIEGGVLAITEFFTTLASSFVFFIEVSLHFLVNLF
jgi:hypothetical protein